MRVESRLSGSRFLENLAYLVPCSIGYKVRGQRREEDSRLRAILLQRLLAIRGAIDELRPESAGEGEQRWAELLDTRAHRLDRIGMAIRHAPYGFSGFFETEEIAENTLDRILEVDLLLFEDLDVIRELLAPPGAPLFSDNSRDGFLQEIDEAIRRFEHHLILRDKLLGNA